MWWKVTIGVVFTVICIALILVFGSVGLKIGASVYSKDVPGKLTYKKISGPLFGPYTVQGLDYQYAGNHLHINRLYLRWRDLDFKSHHINIEALTARGVYWTMGTVSTTAGVHFENFINKEIQLVKAKQKKQEGEHAPAEQPVADVSLGQQRQSVDDHSRSGQAPAAKVKKNGAPPIQAESEVKNNFHWNVRLKKVDLSDIHIGREENVFPLYVPTATMTLFLNHNKVAGDLAIKVVRPEAGLISAKLSGTPEHYRFVSSIKSKDSHFIGTGSGDLSQFKTDQLSGHLLGGYLNGKVLINWQPLFSWQWDLQLDQINLSKVIPKALPQSVSGSLKLKGKEHQLDFSLKGLRARWADGRYLQMRLQFLKNESNITGLSLHMKSDTDFIAVNGDYAATWNMSWQLSIDKLRSWLPDWRGRFISSGHITGLRNRPQVKGQINASGLKKRRNTIGNVMVQWNVDTTQKTASMVHLKVSEIAANPFFMDQLMSWPRERSPQIRSMGSYLQQMES